jgi:hypothetical protein
MPTMSIDAEDVSDYFSYLAFFASLDNPTSSTLTQEVLDWHPTHPGLLEDLVMDHYLRA